MQDLYIQAEAFISSMQQFESKPADSRKWAQRLLEIRESIETTGSYTHTSEELAFGAKLAWRNSNRCIGRHYWRQLDVFDCRSITDASQIYKALERHVEQSYNGGSIKSTVSILLQERLTAKQPTPSAYSITNSYDMQDLNNLMGQSSAIHTTKALPRN